jgi:hypothetical protein
MSNRSAQFLLFILIGLSPAQSNSGINGEKRSRHIQAVDPIVLNGVSVKLLSMKTRIPDIFF